MANISHLPHVLANLLVAQAAGLLRSEGEEGTQLPAVGPSFRDATRVAGANSAIWTDIYMANGDALLAAIDELSGRLQRGAGDARGGRRRCRGRVDRARPRRPRRAARRRPRRRLGARAARARPEPPGRDRRDRARARARPGVNIGDLALSPSRDNSQGVVALWVGGEEQAARAQELVAGLGFPVVRA